MLEQQTDVISFEEDAAYPLFVAAERWLRDQGHSALLHGRLFHYREVETCSLSPLPWSVVEVVGGDVGGSGRVLWVLMVDAEGGVKGFSV